MYICSVQIRSRIRVISDLKKYLNFQFIATAVKTRLDLHAIEMKEDLPRVNTAATLFQEYCYQYRDQFSAGILCCGYDEVDGGQGKFFLFFRELPDFRVFDFSRLYHR